MTLHAFSPGIELVVFATLVLLLFKYRIKPTFRFWMYCIGVSYASKLLAALLIISVISILPFEVDEGYHYLRFPIWLLFSIIGIRLFTQNILKRLAKKSESNENQPSNTE